MARGVISGVGLFVVAALALPGPVASAGVVSVNFWDVRAGYAVLADAGAMPVPDQGLEALPLGAFSSTWQQSDGIAHAHARVDSVITLEQSGGGLDFRAQIATWASASVGDNPDYAFEHAAAEALLDFLVLDITLHEAATLEITGASLGGYAPGLHTLQAGSYLLDLTGPRGSALAEAWANQSASVAGSLQIGARIVPGVGGLWVLGLAALPRRRGRA